MTAPLKLLFDPERMSPYRIEPEDQAQVACANAFLEYLALRRLSPRTLRSYGYSLLDAVRWACRYGKDLLSLREVDLHEYVLFQRERRSPAVSTINHRLTVLSTLRRYYHEKDLSRELTRGLHFPGARPGRRFPHRQGSFRVKGESRLIRPLPAAEIGTFLGSLRTWRDLSIVHLMLLSGLRCGEVLGLTLDALSFEGASVRVPGKGRKERVAPLSPQSVLLLSSYLDLERPQSPHPALFLCLKGARRGRPMTAAGLRSLFRHHEKRTGLRDANPHRFRHTFGTRCVQAGMSLSVLRRILGHVHIDTTLRYVHVSDTEVMTEFTRVMRILESGEDNVEP